MPAATSCFGLIASYAIYLTCKLWKCYNFCEKSCKLQKVVYKSSLRVVQTFKLCQLCTHTHVYLATCSLNLFSWLCGSALIVIGAIGVGLGFAEVMRKDANLTISQVINWKLLREVMISWVLGHGFGRFPDSGHVFNVCLYAPSIRNRPDPS